MRNKLCHCEEGVLPDEAISKLIRGLLRLWSRYVASQLLDQQARNDKLTLLQIFQIQLIIHTPIKFI